MIKLLFLGIWSLKPTKDQNISVIDGLIYWVEFATRANYRFLGFFYGGPLFSRSQILVRVFMKIAKRAIEKELKDKRKQEFCLKIMAEISSYM